MATEFVNTLKNTGGDYELMSTWESNTQCVLTAAGTKVFTHGGITGTIANNDSVTGATSGATGTVVGATTATQILIDGISGTFQSGEAIEVDASNYVTTSDAGDSAIAVLECDAFTCTEASATTVTIDGWTVDASNYIIIRAAAGAEHKGVWGDGFVLEMAKSYGYGLYLKVQYCQLHNIEITNTVAGQISVSGLSMLTADNFLIDGVLITVTGASGDAFTGLMTGTVRNCVARPTSYGFSNTVWKNTTFQNCTSIGGTHGFSKATAQGGYGTATNCVSSGASTSDFITVGLTTTYCASEDATAIGTGSITGIASTDFVDYAGDDYRIDDTSALYGTGSDLTGTFTNDVRSTATRISTSPDIGAYKFDVVTKVLVASAGAGEYELMSTWESTEQDNLVELGERHVLECDAFTCTETVAVVMAGWTTGASNYITIKAASGAEHGGVIGAGFILQGLTSSWATGVTLQIGYTEFYDVEIAGRNAAGTAFNLSSRDSKFIRCIFQTIGAGAHASTNCFLTGTSDSRAVVRNCLFVLPTTGGAAFEMSGFDGTGSYIENNTAITAASYGFNVSSHTSGSYDIASFQNNVSIGATTADILYSSSKPDIYINNASGDSTAVGTDSVTGVLESDFVDFDNDDYQPTSAGALAGEGKDLSGTFTDDITGTTRSTWDIGAYIAAAAAAGFKSAWAKGANTIIQVVGT